MDMNERQIAALERVAAGRPLYIVVADKDEKQGDVRYSVKDKPAPGSCTAPDRIGTDPGPLRRPHGELRRVLPCRSRPVD